MGIMNHNAIIAITWNDEKADDLQKWINELTEDDRKLIVQMGSWINGYHTFVVVPDGSKEGWEHSDKGDFLREQIINRLSEDNYGDKSSPWDWVEIGFGEYGQKVLRGNCTNCYDDSEYAGEVNDK